jgi:hypothetical protein
MKRLLVTVLFCALISGAGVSGLHAQELHRQWQQQEWERQLMKDLPDEEPQQDYTDVRSVEVEIGFGAGIGSGRLPYGTSPQSGLSSFVETRYNFAGYLDVGLQSSIGSFFFKRNGRSYSMDYSPMFAMLVDYNMRRWRSVSLFGGLGAGAAWIEHKDPSGNRIADEYVFLNPRVGAEFWNHLRVTLEYKLMKKEYSYFGITIGGVIGGGYRR